MTQETISLDDFKPIPPGGAYPGLGDPTRGATYEERCAQEGMARARYWAGDMRAQKHGVAFRPSAAGPVADLQPLADLLGECISFTVMEAPRADDWEHPGCGRLPTSRQSSRTRPAWRYVQPHTAART